MLKKIALLGSTGSIGIQTLQVIDMNPELFEVVSLVAAGNNLSLLKEQIIKYKPKLVSIANKDNINELHGLNYDTKISFGIEGIKEAAIIEEADIVVSAISGAAGLIPTLAAIQAGKDIALANKETLVTAGSIIMKEVKKQSVKLLPVDSEHSAIFQCFDPEQRNSVQSIILTASGGPFRGYTNADFDNITPREALKHPTWNMGKKVSIDSATLMNKGLEAIEAHWLFNMPYENIEVIIHPQSIIHSMVRYKDGSILAHLGNPDMRIPIQYALTYPDRKANHLQPLDFTKVGKLTFESPDYQNFPCLNLAFEAGKAGGVLPTVLNAANEVAVDLFLKGKIKFKQIAAFIEKALEKSNQIEDPNIEDILETDATTRNLIEHLYSKGLIK